MHLIGAAVWAGGHIVLVTTILPNAFKTGNTDFLCKFESMYEKVGIPALLTQLSTGLYLGFIYLPKMDMWFVWSNPVSAAISIKLCLMLATVMLAADARIRIIPKLHTGTLKALAWHIVPVSVISVGFVVTAAFIRH